MSGELRARIEALVARKKELLQTMSLEACSDTGSVDCVAGAVTDHGSDDGSMDVGRTLFNEFPDLFRDYPVTSYALATGRVDPTMVFGMLGDASPLDGIRAHWVAFAQDAALASPDQFESVLASALASCGAEKSRLVERVARKAQLQTLRDALVHNPEAFDRAQAIAQCKVPFLAARRIACAARTVV